MQPEARGILYVDDESHSRKWFALCFGDEFEVATAGSADEALAILAAKLGGAVYHMLRKREAFDEERFWQGRTPPSRTGSSSLSHKESGHVGD